MVRVLLADMQEADRADFVNAADTQGITPLFLALQKGAAVLCLLAALHNRVQALIGMVACRC